MNYVVYKLFAITRLPGLRIVLATIFSLISIPAYPGDADLRSTGELRDLFFGEALFYDYQQDYFSAVTLLDAELAQLYALDDPKRDSLSYHREESELFVADMELSYRMHTKVGRAMQRLLDKSVHPDIRNQAAYRLARIAFTKSAYDDAISSLDRIEGKIDEELRNKATLLRGQSLIALQQYQQAIDVLMQLKKAPGLAGYVDYNLGVAYTGLDDPLNAYKYLNAVGTMQAGNRELAALRDKANLTIGAALLKSEKASEARPYLERVQLDSAFSNKALLWVGWSNASEGKYEQALVPWMLLRKRDITDVAVQEALLAAPYGFSQLKAFGKSAILYGEAVEKIDREISRLEDSMRSIREGKFLKAMLSEEAGRDELWLFKLGSSKDAPETRYLRNLLASHSFNESYKNYRELDQLRRIIEQHLQDLVAYKDLIQRRKNYYAPLLDTTESSYARVQGRLQHTLARRDALAKQLDSLLRKREPMRFATSGERDQLRKLQLIRDRINRLRAQAGKDILLKKHSLLEGFVRWNIDTGYEQRLSLAHRHLRELDTEIGKARRSQQQLLKKKSEAALSYQGYDQSLQQLQQRLRYLKDRTDGLLAYQGQYMERRAISELNRRKHRLQRYRTKARFAMAESYDLAIRAQSGKKK